MSTTIRNGRRTVPCPRVLAEVAHVLRYERPLTQAERYIAASGLDTLLSLVAAHESYGPRTGDRYVREVLALMATGWEEGK
jgi:hypothetical protein